MGWALRGFQHVLVARMLCSIDIYCDVAGSVLMWRGANSLQDVNTQTGHAVVRLSMTRRSFSTSAARKPGTRHHLSCGMVMRGASAMRPIAQADACRSFIEALWALLWSMWKCTRASDCKERNGQLRSSREVGTGTVSQLALRPS